LVVGVLLDVGVRYLHVPHGRYCQKRSMLAQIMKCNVDMDVDFLILVIIKVRELCCRPVDVKAFSM
jgi:hypothetical protein